MVTFNDLIHRLNSWNHGTLCITTEKNCSIAFISIVRLWYFIHRLKRLNHFVQRYEEYHKVLLVNNVIFLDFVHSQEPAFTTSFPGPLLLSSSRGREEERPWERDGQRLQHNKQYQMKEILSSLYLNGHTLGLHPITQS